MSNDFVAEILRATGTLRSGDPAGATDIIQAALAAGGLRQQGGDPAPRPPADGPNVQPRPRRSLDEVVRTLAEGRRKLRPMGAPSGRNRTVDVSLPEAAEFRDLQHSHPAGARRYRLYVPSTGAEGLQGLIVMLHGCTQNPEDFAAGTGMNAVAEEHRLLIAYPGQTGSDNAMSCWNWFRPGDQGRGAGEPAILASLAESIRDEFAIDPDRVFVAGLSAGGAMAAILGETYPELFTAIGVHSGLAPGSATDVASAFAAMRGQAGVGAATAAGHPRAGAPRVIVFHGSADTTVHPSNAARIVARHAGEPAQSRRTEHAPSGGQRGYARLVAERHDGRPALECWMVEGAEHAWSGGHPGGTYTDPRGPNASAEMARFFLGLDP